MAAAVKRSTARVRAAVSRVVSTASESSRAKSSSLSTLPITSSDSDFLCLGSIFFRLVDTMDLQIGRKNTPRLTGDRHL